MAYTYIPKGVCSRRMMVELGDDNRIVSLVVEGGCDGNLKSIAALVRGQDAVHVAQLLRGITCGHKATSCGDQLSIAIAEAMAEKM